MDALMPSLWVAPYLSHSIHSSSAYGSKMAGPKNQCGHMTTYAWPTTLSVEMVPDKFHQGKYVHH